MQKKLIALAVAGLVSAPAFAQSNVTVYGVADAGVAFGSAGANDLRGVLSGVLSGSRVGFRGTEDLGNGLKAVFVLEQGFDIGNGVASPGVSTKRKIVDGEDEIEYTDGDSVFSRQAYVGLSGAFGTVSLGRQYAPGFGQQYDAVASAAVSPQSILSSGAGMTITPNSPARWDNSVAYGGSFSGLSVKAIYAARGTEVSTSPNDDDAYGLGVEYANGPLKVGAVYHYLKSATAGSAKQKEWLLGGSYNFGVVTLAASYQDAKAVGNVKNADADLWQVGVIVPVGAAGNVHVAYGDVDFDNASKAGAKSYTLAYTHALSKRTTAYAGFNRTDNDNNTSKYGVVAGTKNGNNSDVYTVGLRHTF
ncbi:porin [Thauera sp. 27]|uniref:porin n=1 Tax=Thauera sp. 27 TaxID=305700 RepID=UPI0002CE375F|nr:porin [Thauera sp. 27]ENO75556.1 porin [Thauera sp. 27]